MLAVKVCKPRLHGVPQAIVARVGNNADNLHPAIASGNGALVRGWSFSTGILIWWPIASPFGQTGVPWFG